MSNSAKQAERLKELIHARTGINPKQLVCPREKSEMTPCVARDGALTVAADGCCVGCGQRVEELLKQEELRHVKSA